MEKQLILGKNFIKIWLILFILAIFIIFFGIFIKSADAVNGLDLSYKQVKTANSPDVYYLDHKRGFKKLYVNEIAYLTYGNIWSDIKVVEQSQLDLWPELRLVKAPNQPGIFYIKNKQKAKIISEQQFLDLGFSWNEVITISQTDLDTYQVKSIEEIYPIAASLSQGFKDGVLKVSLDNASPKSTYLPTGSRNDTILALKFQAIGKDINISKITFTRYGIANDDIIDAVYLVDEAGTILSPKATLSNRQAYFNLANEPIKISAGQTRIILVKIDLRPNTSVLGQTVSFAINQARDIESIALVGGSFPVFGAEHKLVNGANYLGKVKVSLLPLNLANKEIKIGSKNQAVFSFRLKEVSNIENILIKKITLTNIGSAEDNDLRNVRLYNQAGKLIANVQTPVNKKINFILAPGYALNRSRQADFTIKLDVIKGDGRDIKFIINDKDDIEAVSQDNGYQLAVVSDQNFPLSGAENDNRFKIKRQPLFATTVNINKTQLKIYRDQADAIIGSFEIRNNAGEIKLDSLKVSVMALNNAPVLDEDLILADSKTKAEISSVNGQNVSNNTQDIRLGNYLMKAGETFKFIFKTHIPDTAGSGSSYRVKLESINYRIDGDNELYTDNLSVLGQELKVIKPTLTLFAGKFLDKDLAVAGKNKVKLGTFKVEASSDEKVKITSITITSASGYTPITYSNGFSNLALYRGSSKISNIIAEPNSNSYTFENLKVEVSAGKAIDLNVMADTSDNVSGKVKLILENIEAEGSPSKAPAEINNKGAGSPEASFSQTQVEVAVMQGGVVDKNKKENLIASFKFTNKASEAVKLKSIVVITEGCGGDISSSNGYTNLKFGYVQNNKIKQVGSKLSQPVSGSNQISLGSFKLGIGETITLNLYIDADQNVTAGTMNLSLQDLQALGYLTGVTATVVGIPTNPVDVVVK